MASRHPTEKLVKTWWPADSPVTSHRKMPQPQQVPKSEQHIMTVYRREEGRCSTWGNGRIPCLPVLYSTPDHLLPQVPALERWRYLAVTLVSYVKYDNVASRNLSVLSGSAGYYRRHDSGEPTFRSLLAAMGKLGGTGWRTTGKQAFAPSTPVRGEMISETYR